MINIEELEVEINLDIVNGWGEVTYTKTELKQLCEAYAAKVLEDKDTEVAELQAHINDLREALEELLVAYRVAVKLYDLNHDDAYTVKAHNAIAKARNIKWK